MADKTKKVKKDVKKDKEVKVPVTQAEVFKATGH